MGAADTTSVPQKPEPTADLAAAVSALDAVMKTEPVDPSRVYLTGLSMGGYGSWGLAARMPGRFAAVIPICGGGDEATASKLAMLPSWCFHGPDDDMVPVARSRSMVQAVGSSGSSGADVSRIVITGNGVRGGQCFDVIANIG
ncbi:MAG: hypothetical protein ACKOHG_12900 [Planctomycetia bacterium]